MPAEEIESPPWVMVADDLPSNFDDIKLMLEDTVFKNRLLYARDLRTAIDLIETDSRIGIALIDWKMPDRRDGERLLQQIRQSPRATEIYAIMMSRVEDPQEIFEAKTKDFGDFLVSPPNPFELNFRLRAALRHLRLSQTLKQAEANQWSFIVRSPGSLGREIELAQRFAKTSEPVLLLGESGVGKEEFSQGIHQASGRKSLIAVNCPALQGNADQARSELFGHVKGAFTGATADRPGKMLAAHEGTLFLDEIGDLPLAIQPMLLRALQDKWVAPMGTEKTQRSDFRLIAATNRDLAAMVREGTFREDLYHRIKVACIRIPPLRHRKQDIRLLADHFLAQLRKGDKSVLAERFAEDGYGWLEVQPWTGNVRQLANFVRLAGIMATGTDITAEALSLLHSQDDSTPIRADRHRGSEPPQGADFDSTIRGIAEAIWSAYQESYVQQRGSSRTYEDLIDDLQRCILSQQFQQCGFSYEKLREALRFKNAGTVKNWLIRLGIVAGTPPASTYSIGAPGKGAPAER